MLAGRRHVLEQNKDKLPGEYSAVRCALAARAAVTWAAKKYGRGTRLPELSKAVLNESGHRCGPDFDGQRYCAPCSIIRQRIADARSPADILRVRYGRCQAASIKHPRSAWQKHVERGYAAVAQCNVKWRRCQVTSSNAWVHPQS
jgi:hypothetical protein